MRGLGGMSGKSEGDYEGWGGGGGGGGRQD